MLNLEDIIEGYKFRTPLKIKEVNYLDGYAFGTNRKDYLDKTNLLWSDLNAGDSVQGTISRIIPTPSGSAKLIISINKLVTGIVDENNITDS